MFIYIASAEARAFLELLKPLFVNVEIGRLCIHNLHSKRINIYSDFFESKYISNILIRDVEEPFTDLSVYSFPIFNQISSIAGYRIFSS